MNNWRWAGIWFGFYLLFSAAVIVAAPHLSETLQGVSAILPLILSLTLTLNLQNWEQKRRKK